MKTIQGKGGHIVGDVAWLAVVPDDATSCTDPRAKQIKAPAQMTCECQTAWLEGYAAAVKGYKAREAAERVGSLTALRVRARNNHSLPEEQDITTWTDRDPSLVGVAIGLDEAELEALDRRAYSGLGAGAVLLAVIDGVEEEIRAMDHPALEGLPAGHLDRLRRHIADQSGQLHWDGQNHITIPTSHCSWLLENIRQAQTAPTT